LLQFEGGFAEQAGTAAGGHESQPRGLFGPEMLWVRPSANEGTPRAAGAAASKPSHSA